ncbi:MAG: 60S ribosomal protein L22 [Candidatus Bathycorpusculaceae bacterium]
MEMRIDISELKGEGSDLIGELANFLEEKTGAEVKTEKNEMIVKSEEESLSKKYLRVLLKKFLHKNELRESFRVIGGKENTLTVKEKGIEEEE